MIATTRREQGDDLPECMCNAKLRHLPFNLWCKKCSGVFTVESGNEVEL